MREGERRQRVWREEAHLLALRPDVDAPRGNACRVGDEDHALARPRVGAEQPLNAHVEAGLLLRLARGRLFERLAGVDEAGGEGPLAQMGLMIAAHEQQAPSAAGEHANGYLGLVEVDGAALRTDLAPATEDGATAERHPALRAEASNQDPRC